MHSRRLSEDAIGGFIKGFWRPINAKAVNRFPYFFRVSFVPFDLAAMIAHLIRSKKIGCFHIRQHFSLLLHLHTAYTIESP